ncbi:MAG: PAS domain S-box protein [Gammaproteobacteria bacterium]|nr:PAS domain S-box protein [Gammaproteobacteria bacterium]
MATAMLLLAALGLLLPMVIHHPASFLPLLPAAMLAGRLQRPLTALAIAVLGTVVLLSLSLWESGLPELRVNLASILVLITTWVLAVLAGRMSDTATEWWLSGSSFQQAFDHSPTGMALVSPQLRVLYVNDTLAKMLGRPRSSLIGASLRHLVTAEDWEGLAADHQRLLAGEMQVGRGEYLLERADGSAFWASVNVGIVTDRRQRVAFTIDQVVDMTPMQRAEQALRESEARFRGIIEYSTAITFIIDRGGHITYLNPAFLKLLGVSAEQALGANPTAFMDERDHAEFAKVLERSRERPSTPIALPYLRLRTPEGKWIFLDAKVTGLYSTPGIAGAVVNGQEITGQVQAERALRRSETRFAALFETSRDAILLTRTSDGIALDFNEAFTELTGHQRDSGLGRPSSELLRVADGNDIARFSEMLEAENHVVDLETVVITADGRARETSLSGRYAELDGELCVVVVLRDISARRRTEAALRESEDKFARVFHRSPDAMLITRLADDLVIDVNDNFVALLQRPRAVLVGHGAHELESQLPLSDIRNHWAALIDDQDERGEDSGGYATAEVTLNGPDGPIPALVSTTVVDIQGDPCAITLIKDMRELRQAQELVAESEARFRGAFESAPIGMMLVDPDGRITQVNRTLCELLDRDAEELVDAEAASLLVQDARDTFSAHLQALVAGESDEDSGEAHYLTGSGAEITTNRHMVVQRHPDGSPLHLIIQIADITEMKQSQERMERLAFYDTLTDLANRRLFADRLEQAVRQAIRHGRPAALLYLDLDNFKRVNDTLGHEAGDVLLKTVAERLRTCVRDEDTVARPGGDEFTILLQEVQDARAAGKVARKILRRLQEPIVLGNHEVRVTTSIGITLAPDDGSDPATLTKNADLAMYRAKERGRDNYQFFAEEMNTRAMERLLLENDLRGSLANDGFEIYYQPKVRISSGEVVGLEALLRWKHPERGVLRPEQFMQIAEESGLIVEIGQWVLHHACQDAARIRRASSQPLHVAVNLSARQFSDPNLPGAVRAALVAAQLDPACLELEITETMLMGDVDEAISTLDALRELGVTLSIDDFGTGYSSLNYLKRLPIDLIKVDRGFVSDIPDSADDMAITAAVIAMAHQLNLAVVAEGVETRAQAEFLESHGCEYGQGYLYGRPCGIDAMLEALQSGPTAIESPEGAQNSSKKASKSSSGGSPL